VNHSAECRSAECCSAECRSAECRSAECRSAECRSAECRSTERRLLNVLAPLKVSHIRHIAIAITRFIEISGNTN
jgi:hypothetical protein